MAKITEIALAEAIIDWLREHHWEIYQEVQIFASGSVADIVAVQNKIVWVIETKTTLSLQVMDQAWQWTPYAHYVSIGVPKAHTSRPQILATVLEHLRIGMLTVDCGLYSQKDVYERMKPPLNRKARSQRITKLLKEEHKTFAKAGNPDGNRYSPWKGTCRELIRAVNKNPGLGIGELVDMINHHYCSSATAKSALIQWIKYDKIPGIRLERVGRKLFLYPK